MNTREWFDEGAYSDLTIKLSNGTEVKVHKVIICRVNEYFRKLCGPGSRFAVSCIPPDDNANTGHPNAVYQESKQGVIELKDDDPLALTAVLRHIYKLDCVMDANPTCWWRAWLSIRVTADKYLEPELSSLADTNFRALALKSTDSDDIFDIVETIDDEMAHDESLVALGKEMRDNNRGKLLKNDRYRAQLDDRNREALWGVIDGLVFAADLEQKRHHLCGQHHNIVFKKPTVALVDSDSDTDKDSDTDDKLVDYCPVCRIDSNRRNASGYGGYSDGKQHEERTVWTPK